ncbi:hypothetical protein BDR04DRAFT_1101657 [Suillus decipiens]|nr:hypothetical protein BDR04DRAFT_1101657 [Suillus decipiens]
MRLADCLGSDAIRFLMSKGSRKRCSLKHQEVRHFKSYSRLLPLNAATHSSECPYYTRFSLIPSFDKKTIPFREVQILTSPPFILINSQICRRHHALTSTHLFL